MINTLDYKDWSAKFHEAHASEPIVMQMELTYRCPIHCLHCYADCYNYPGYVKEELPTKNIKKIMDKARAANCVWFTFTGGDPMMRKDFVELYRYAKSKGFILSVMTSLAAMTDEMLKVMEDEPPFSLDMTLNGATERTYENISQVKGSFKKVVGNIDKALKAGLPLKIKTLLSKNNIHEKKALQDFVEARGLKFAPSTMIFARLNGDASVCAHRLPVDDVINFDFPDDECGAPPGADKPAEERSTVEIEPRPERFYKCAIGNWQWHIDPKGFLNICSCVRQPSYDILNGDIIRAVQKLSVYVKTRSFSEDSECRMCRIWHICHSCPGKAKLETGKEESPVEYFCEMAKKQAKKMDRINKADRG